MLGRNVPPHLAAIPIVLGIATVVSLLVEAGSQGSAPIVVFLVLATLTFVSAVYIRSRDR